MHQNVKAVIFDLDGTLVDSMWMWKAIDIEYLARFGIEIPEGLQKAIEGKSFSETAEYFKEHFQLPDPLEKIKEDWNRMAWDKYANQVPLKEGVAEYLEYLRENKIKMGIATSNSRELVDLVTKTLNVHSYFSSIRTSCEVEKGKPAPDIYLLVAKDLEVAPEECLVYEDVIHGIIGGKSANMKVCAVEDEFSAAERAKKQELADYYIENYHQVDRI